MLIGNTGIVSDRSEVKAQIVHILYADVVGYSRLPLESKQNVDQALQSAVSDEISSGGVITAVDNGDGFFLAFGDDPQRAAEAAWRLHSKFAQDLTVRIRIGLHSGVAFLRQDIRNGINLTGPAVERAQRIMSVGNGEWPFVSLEMWTILKEFESWRHRLVAPTLVRIKGDEMVAVWRLGTLSQTPDLLVTEPGQIEELKALGFRVMLSELPRTIEEIGLLARISHSYPSGVFTCLPGGFTIIERGDSETFFETVSDAISALIERRTSRPSFGHSVWVEREADRMMRSAVENRVSFILVRSARFTGKTTLLVAGKAYAESIGTRAIFHDFRSEDSEVIQNNVQCYKSIAQTLFRQLGIDLAAIDQLWNQDLGANSNLERCVEYALSEVSEPIFWAWDEAERLMHQTYADDLFGLLRSWHNRRAWEGNSPWARLTIAFTYRVDAGAVIRNQQQSPFNVGLDVVIRDFSRSEMAELSRQFGDVIVQGADLDFMVQETGGHPMLASSTFELMSSGSLGITELKNLLIPPASRLLNHLNDLWRLISSDPKLKEACRLAFLKRANESSNVSGLVDLGVLIETRPGEFDFRANIYQRYFKAQLR